MTRRWSTLGLVTLAVAAAGALPAGAQTTPSRVQVWTCDDCDGDSLAVARAKADLQRVTAQHQALIRSMEEARRSGVEVERTRAKMMQLQGQMMRLSMQLSAARPRGWIGLNLEGPQEMRLRDGEMTSWFPEYPVIVAVDPNSPADRAGVRRGDVLLAMNGKDLRKGVVMTSLLRPDSRLKLHLRRDGKARDVTVNVAKAPGMVVQRRMAFVEPGRVPEIPTAPEPPTPPAPFEFRNMDPRTIESVEIRQGARADGQEARIFVFPRVDGLAGADMRTLDADLAESFGVARGVFVVSTASSSLAREAGLRGGDVIVAADGQPIDEVRDLRQLAAKVNGSAGKGDREMTLEVVRAGGKKRVVVLRW